MKGSAVSEYIVSKSFESGTLVGAKSAAVMRMFGLTAEKLNDLAVCHRCRLKVRDGDIVYITGASGTGKSVLLREFEKLIPAEERVNLNEIELEAGRAVADCIDGEILDCLKYLSAAGLSDCLCMLNEPRFLSEGQQWRYRLAMAMAAKKKYIFADEFCSNLDRITAAVISHNIHKFAKREKVTFFLASCHDDILSDLWPDTLVVKDFSGEAEVVYKN